MSLGFMIGNDVSTMPDTGIETYTYYLSVLPKQFEFIFISKVSDIRFEK